MPLEAQGKIIHFGNRLLRPLSPLTRCSFDRILTEDSKEMIEALPSARCLNFDQVHIGTAMIKSSNNILKNLSIFIFLQQHEPLVKSPVNRP